MLKKITGCLMLLALAAAAGVMTQQLADRVLCRTPLTTDEQSYVFQVNTFLEGGFSRPCPPFAPLLSHKMNIMERETGWVSRYPPGHALFLLPGAWAGSPYFSVYFGAGLALLLIALAAALAAGAPPADGVAAAAGTPAAAGLFAGVLLLISPWFLFTFATLLSHTSGLLAVSGLLVCHLWWRRSGRPGAALLAGLAWGFLCVNRTYTALLMALPFGVDALWMLAVRRDKRTLRGVALFAGGAAAGALALLFYNHLILGNPFKMTYLYYEPLEALGFGQRHYGLHTLAKGWKILKNNLRLADGWLWGFPGGLILWAGLLLAGRPRRRWLILAGPVIAVPAGYLFFFHRGPHETGPGYYFEILPFIIAGAAAGAGRLWRMSARTPAIRRWAVLALALAVLAGPVRFGLKAAQALRETIEPRRALLATIARAPADGLVFIVNQGWQGDHPLEFATANPHGLSSAPLVMLAADGAEVAAARYFKNRRPFRLTGGAPAELRPMDRNAPYAVSISPARAHRRTGTDARAADDAPTERVARAGRDRKGMLVFGNYRCVCPSRFTALFELETAGAGGPPAVLDVSADNGRRILAERAVPPGVQGAQALDFEADDFFNIEPRVYYTGEGDVRVKSIRIVERPD